MYAQIAGPIDADTLAQQQKLGSLRDTCELHRNSGCILFFLPVLILFFTILPLLLLFTFIPIQTSLSLSGSFVAPLFLLIFASFGTFVTIRLMMTWLQNYRRRGSALLLYTNGLILLQYQRKQLIFSEALHWQEVALVWHKIKVVQSDDSTRIIHTYSIQSKQGTMFGGDSFQFNSVKLGHIVEEETLPYLWPSTIDAYQRGALVTFGTINVSSVGIGHNGQLLDWQSVKSIRSDRNGLVTIKQRSDTVFSSWAKIKDANVPNIHLLYALLTFVGHQQGPTAFSLENKR